MAKQPTYLNIQDIETQDRWGNHFILPNLEPVSFHLLISGVYKPLTLQLLFKILRRGSVFVDVGAHIGTIALNQIKNVRARNYVILDRPMDRVSFFESPQSAAA